MKTRMAKSILPSALMLSALWIFSSTQVLAATNAPRPYPGDPCGAPNRINYVQMVTTAGIQNCGQDVQDFSLTASHGGVSLVNNLQDPNIYYSVLVQDPGTGKSLSAVVKCDVGTGQASIVALNFAALTSYGTCSVQ